MARDVTLKFLLFGEDKTASKALKKVGTTAEETGSKVKHHSAVIAGGVAGAALALVGFGKSSVEAFQKAEEGQAQLSGAFKKFPALANVNIGALRSLNSALALKTRYDDDSTASAESQLAQFKLSGTQIKTLIPLVQDLASRQKVDLGTAATEVGKAMLGNAKALKSVGIIMPSVTAGSKQLASAQHAAAAADEQVTRARQRLADVHALLAGKEKLSVGDKIRLRDAEQTLTGAVGRDRDAHEKLTAATKNAHIPTSTYTTLVGKLRAQVGGFATEEGKTAAGRLAILRNQFDEVKEAVGAKLVPVLTQLATRLLQLIAFVQRNQKVLVPLVAIVGTLVGTLFALHKGLGLITMGMRLFGATSTLSLGPVGLIIAGVAALAVGLIYAYKHSATFRRIVLDAFHAVQAAAKFMWERVLKPILRLWVREFTIVAGAIVHGAAFAFGWVPGLGPKLRSAAKAFDTFKRNVNRALAGVVSRQVTVTATFNTGSGVVATKVRAGQAAKAARYAAGGPVQGGQPGRDSVPILAKPGEFVVRDDGSNLADAWAYFARKMAAGGLVVAAHTPGSPTIRSKAAAIGTYIDQAAASYTADLARSWGAMATSAPGVGGGVTRWTNVVLAVLRALHQSAANLGAVLRRIRFESGGNPNAINLTDINAQRGYPSRGLMQTIPQTFNAYAGAYRGRGITDPFANIYAGLAYAIRRYGSIAAIDPLVRPRGYDRGGMLPPGLSLAYNGTGRPEPVGGGNTYVTVNITHPLGSPQQIAAAIARALNASASAGSRHTLNVRVGG